MGTTSTGRRRPRTADAEEGLLAWARGLGQLAAESVPHRADLADLWLRYGDGTPAWEDLWISRTTAGMHALLAEARITAPPGLDGDLALIEAVGRDEYPAFTPGDTCPDNNLLTLDGLRLLDFESACYRYAG